jgi:hypothetical protein
VEPKRIYLDERSEDGVEVIIRSGLASSMSAAVRIAVIRFAATVAPPLAAPTTP